MNQDKIGKFIAQLRKEKGMTQQDLAYQLHVTDRAISNWENGRRIPDISLLKPLCECFDISVSELISGEKIEEEKFKSNANDIMINTLANHFKMKAKSKYMIGTLVIILCIALALFLYFFKTIYPKIDIYNLVVSLDENSQLKKQFTYQEKQIYYYGITSLQLCNTKEYCFDIHNALSHHQIRLKEIEHFLDFQNSLNHNQKFILYDGGTMIYENDFYSAIFCNTLNGNKDIYFGASDMVEQLDGVFCGHKKNPNKSFIRTYHIVSIKEEDKEYFYVTIRHGNELATVQLHNTTPIIVGKDYEFTFVAFKEFEDTISNLFQYATILSVKETDKSEEDQTNESIYVNIEEDKTEVEGVSMNILEGTLTKTSATIIVHDRNGTKYVYGEPFRIEKLENEIWTPLEGIGYFNEPAYYVDRNGILMMKQDWNSIYGILPNGKYRLVKEIFLDEKRPITEIDKKDISVEFTIE